MLIDNPGSCNWEGGGGGGCWHCVGEGRQCMREAGTCNVGT